MGGSIDTIVRNDIKTEVKEPPRFKVILLNDDITTMEFVISLLCRVFNKSTDEATDIMWQVHNNGKGVCGIYTQEIAEAKVGRTRLEAMKAGFPLRCIMEPE